MERKTVGELVSEAGLGSSRARDELVRRHYRETVVLAAALVNDATEAEDLAQEAFIRAFRNLDLLVDPARFGAWLRRIVVGVSVDRLRSFRPGLHRGWNDADELSIASSLPSPLDLVLRSEMVARVQSALDALPPRYRVPIRLYHLDGLSHAKIAAALEIPVATVRSLVARARAKLAPLLAEYAPDARDIQEVFKERIVTDPPEARFLHVANGTSVTMTVEAAGIPGAVSIWADPLHDGPVPAGLTDEELVDVRMRFLAGPPDERRSPDHPSLDPKNDLRQWRSNIARHKAYEELILWFEFDLFDQLNLIQLLTWIREHVPADKAVSLICIGSFPGRADFKGLGELATDELASLLETRQRVTDAQYELAARAWNAFREPTPEALDHLRRQDTAALPFLSAALTRFLQEYPWTTDGLSRTERRFLRLADGDGITLINAFPRIDDEHDEYHVTGTVLIDLAETLSSASPALVTLGPQPDGTTNVFRRSVTLTETGRTILAGRQDRVTTCGFDRWFGGVHVQSGGTVWRWDDAGQRMTKS